MINRNVVKFSVPILTIGMLLGNVPMAHANSCSGQCSDTFADGTPWTFADCSTYHETYEETGVDGAPVIHTEQIIFLQKTNCSNAAAEWKLNYEYNHSESLSHSATPTISQTNSAEFGYDKAESVGLTAKTELGISHSTQNGWQYTANWSEKITVESDASVPACSVAKFKLFGQYKDGTFSGTKKLNYSVSARMWYELSYSTYSGTCKQMASVAGGAKKYTMMNSVYSVAAASSAICAGCGGF